MSDQLSETTIESILNSIRKFSEGISAELPFRDLRNRISSLKLPRFDWPALEIGNLRARIPIIQGGMGVGISLSNLASAVAEAGGIGVVAANGIGMLEKDYYKDGRAANLRAFRREIQNAKSKTSGIIGVNIMVAVNDFHELLDVAIEEKVDIIFMGAGLAIKDLPVKEMREAGVKAAPIVSSARAATMIFRMWKKIYNDVPDAVVFEGPKAGGHLGFSEEQLEDPAFQLEAIVPEIIETLVPFEEEFGRQIPVIAGGGVYSGEDIYEVLKLGAAGVQMGTRFVATEECDADPAFKECYVEADETDIGLIKSPVGMPGRAIRNQFILDTEAGERPSFRCAWQCLGSCKAEKANYCISVALNNARRGKLKHGFVFAGTNAYRIEKIQTVTDLVGELEAGYRLQAQISTKSRAEALLERLSELRRQYDRISQLIRETGAAYDQALKQKIRGLQNAGMEELRERYTQLQTDMSEIQLKLADRLAESCALFMKRV